MSTVRDLVLECQTDMLNEMTPDLAAFRLSQMTALLGNVNAEIREAEAAYNAVYAKALAEEGKANRAKIRAQDTPEYWRTREAEDTKELVTEMIASLKYVIRNEHEAMRLSRGA